MSDLTKEDQARREAGDKYFKADSRESWDLAIAGNDWNAGWQAACAYKQKEVDDIKDAMTALRAINKAMSSVSKKDRKRIAELEALVRRLGDIISEADILIHKGKDVETIKDVSRLLSEGGGDD